MDDDRTNHAPTNPAAPLADASAQPLNETAQPLNEKAELSDADGELAGRTPASEPRPPVPLSPEELLAQELIAVLDDFSSRFPGLVYPTEKEARRARRHRTVPKIFMQGAMSTVSETILKRTRNFNIDDMRDALHFVDAFAAVVDRVNYLQGAVKYTIDAKKSSVADAALQIYGVARVLSRDPERGDLVGYAKLLKGYLGRKGRGRKRRTPPPTPDESPAVRPE
jgi:hypothetical protein